MFKTRLLSLVSSGKIPSQSKEFTHKLDSPNCYQLCNHLLYTPHLAIATKPNQSA